MTFLAALPGFIIFRESLNVTGQIEYFILQRAYGTQQWTHLIGNTIL